MQGLLHARFDGAFTDFCAIVIFAEGNDRPTIVTAGLWCVDLIATLGTVFNRPKFAGFGMQRCTLDIAMAD